MKYKKKKTIIEAVQWIGNCDIINTFCGNNIEWKWDNNHNIVLIVHTLEGDVVSNFRDYIIKGIENEFYPVSESKFDKIYENIYGWKWQKKPIEVEAIQYNGSISDLNNFCYIYKYNNNKKLMVRSESGTWLEADNGDYIVKEENGYYPVKPNIFKKTYDKID